MDLIRAATDLYHFGGSHLRSIPSSTVQPAYRCQAESLPLLSGRKVRGPPSNGQPACRKDTNMRTIKTSVRAGRTAAFWVILAFGVLVARVAWAGGFSLLV